MGTNIQGPSLIRAPAWLPRPLGTFYLYFADHKGESIRLAYADEIEGPWTVHPPGSLQLAESHFLTEPPPIDADTFARTEARYQAALGEAMPFDIRADLVTPHIASPDVHLDHVSRRVLMYFHGLEAMGHQCTRLAVSSDGVAFTAAPTLLGPSYFRVFRYEGVAYAMVMPGKIFRSADGRGEFEPGPSVLGPDTRHGAVRVAGDTLHVFWTCVGDTPERIYVGTVDLTGDWMEWRASVPSELMRPTLAWEGAEQPLVSSVRGAAPGPVNQLRDPAVFEDGGRTFLLYAVAGESGIAMAELFD